VNLVENAPPGTNVLSNVLGTDPDAGQTGLLTYSLPTNGRGANLFQISSTGLISVRTGVMVTPHWTSQLNFEGQPQITVDINVTDPFGLHAVYPITVQLLDVNEPPGFNNQSAGVVQSAAPGA
jgi:hypothetical protein